jgi:hypothetical protein
MEQSNESEKSKPSSERIITRIVAGYGVVEVEHAPDENPYTVYYDRIAANKRAPQDKK